MSMPHDAQPWTTTHSLHGVPRKQRFLDCIQVAWWAWTLEHMKQPGAKVSDVPAWYVDYSQGVDRKSWGPRPDTITQFSRCYAFHLDRVLDAEDRLSACACQFQVGQALGRM